MSSNSARTEIQLIMEALKTEEALGEATLQQCLALYVHHEAIHTCVTMQDTPGFYFNGNTAMDPSEKVTETLQTLGQWWEAHRDKDATEALDVTSMRNVRGLTALKRALHEAVAHREKKARVGDPIVVDLRRNGEKAPTPEESAKVSEMRKKCLDMGHFVDNSYVNEKLVGELIKTLNEKGNAAQNVMTYLFPTDEKRKVATTRHSFYVRLTTAVYSLFCASVGQDQKQPMELLHVNMLMQRLVPIVIEYDVADSSVAVKSFWLKVVDRLEHQAMSLNAALKDVFEQNTFLKSLLPSGATPSDQKVAAGKRDSGREGKRTYANSRNNADGTGEANTDRAAYCLDFQRGKCRREKCRFRHKCKNCHDSGHGAAQCPKGAEEGDGDATTGES